MGRRLATIWGILAVVVPILVGVGWMGGSLLPPEVQAADLARMAGLRNVALSVVIAAALLTRSTRALAFLLFARGGQDLADGIADLMGGGAGRAIGPMIIALISFAAGWVLLRRGEEPVLSERTA
jgi:hypothetical protein